MIKAVQATALPAPSSTDQGARPAPEARRPAPIEPAPEANVRLTIDESPDGPFFVYTLQDRETGRIIAQLPHHRAEALAETVGYHPGDLLRAEV